jgi:hypothetical protein
MRLLLILTDNRGSMDYFLDLNELELIEWAKVNRELKEEQNKKK